VATTMIADVSSYHFTPANVGQPEVVRANIPLEDERNKVEINQVIEKLKTNGGGVNESDINLLSRLLNNRKSLKYAYDEVLIAQVCSITTN